MTGSETPRPARKIQGYVQHHLRRLSWERLVSCLPYSVGGTAIVALTLACGQRLLQRPSPYFETVVGYSLVALVSVLALRSSGTAHLALSRHASEASLKTWLIVLHVTMWSLVVPIYLLLWRNSYDDMQGWTYQFLNKRWLAALYDLALILIIVLPLAVHRTLSGPGNQGGPSDGDRGHPHRQRSRVASTAGVVLAVAVAWYFSGPPWNIAAHHRSIDLHEQVHLGPLQAIDSGYTPFIGPASTQYGPGTQAVMYGLMKLSGHFDLVAFRQTFATFEFAALIIVAVMAYLVAGPGPMLLIVLLAEAYSPLSYFRFDTDGTLHGFYGWANPLRYLGTLVVIPAVVVAAHGRRSARALTWLGLLLGIAWGGFTWLSQENLSSTVVALGLALPVLVATETIPFATLVRLLGAMTVGFIGTWSIVLVYYGINGLAGSFVRNYLLVAGAVAMGFSNTWWSSGSLDPNVTGYYWTAPFGLAILLLLLWDPRALRPRQHLDQRHALLLSFVCVLLASYQTALYRSDVPHFVNTLIALPFVLVLGIRDLPRAVARTWPGHLLARVVLVAAAIWIYPLILPNANRNFDHDIAMAPPGVDRLLSPDIWTRYLTPPAARFVVPPLSWTTGDSRIPFQRVTRHLTDEPIGSGDIPMRTLLEEGSALHNLVGARKTYVQGMPGVYPGLVYFLFDLTPAPYLFDPTMMAINKELKDESLWHLSRGLGEVECVIAESRSAPELQLFVNHYPHAVVRERLLGGKPYYVAALPPFAEAP